MTAVEFVGGTIQIDPALIAKGLRLDPEALRIGMRDGSVTSTCEAGEGSDAGRMRVTFYSQSHRMRLVFDASGAVLQSSSAPYNRRLRGAVLAPKV